VLTLSTSGSYVKRYVAQEQDGELYHERKKEPMERQERSDQKPLKEVCSRAKLVGLLRVPELDVFLGPLLQS
jgi:hypothetical protein